MIAEPANERAKDFPNLEIVQRDLYVALGKALEAEGFKVKNVEDLDLPGKKARLIVTMDRTIGR